MAAVNTDENQKVHNPARPDGKKTRFPFSFFGYFLVYQVVLMFFGI